MEEEYDTYTEEEHDEQGQAEGEEWILRMKLEDEAIDAYHEAQRQYIQVPLITEFIKHYFSCKGLSYDIMVQNEKLFLESTSRREQK